MFQSAKKGKHQPGSCSQKVSTPQPVVKSQQLPETQPNSLPAPTYPGPQSEEAFELQETQSQPMQGPEGGVQGLVSLASSAAGAVDEKASTGGAVVKQEAGKHGGKRGHAEEGRGEEGRAAGGAAAEDNKSRETKKEEGGGGRGAGKGKVAGAGRAAER